MSEARFWRAVIVVETLTGLTAQQAAGDAYRHLRGRLVRWFGKILFEDTHHHCMSDICADQVQQFERPIRNPAASFMSKSTSCGFAIPCDRCAMPQGRRRGRHD